MNRARRIVKSFIGSNSGAVMSSVLVVVIIAAGSSVIGGFTATALQRSANTRTLADIHRANFIAESGPSDIYTRLTDTGFDWAAHGNSFSFDPVDFAGGRYEVSVDVSGEIVKAHSFGFYNKSRGQAIATFVRIEGDENVNTNDPPFFSPYNYAVLTGGSLLWSGSASSTDADVLLHANQNVLIRGGANCLIAGDISATGAINTRGNPNITGDRKPNEPLVPVPQIDFGPYRTWADDHGELWIDNDFQISNDYTPNGGILFVDGNVKINGGTFRGCVIATGDVHINGNAVLTSHPDYTGLPAIMVETGTLRGNGTADITGLVYVKTANIDKFNGTLVLTGSIIAGGELDATGNFTVFFENGEPVVPWPDPDAGTDSDLCLVAME